MAQFAEARIVRSHNCIRTGLMRLERLAIVRRIGLHTSRDACDTLTPSAGRRDNAPGDPRPASTTRNIQTKTSAAELVLLTGCSGPTCAASGGAGQRPSLLLSRTPWCAGIEPGSGSTCDGARVQAHAEGRKITAEIQALIRCMAEENPEWGAPRILHIKATCHPTGRHVGHRKSSGRGSS